jgi:hypothetical protein
MLFAVGMMALLCCINHCTQGKRCGRQFVVPPQAWPFEPEPGARALALATAQEEARWGIHSSTTASSTAAVTAAAATTRIHTATTVHSSSSGSGCSRCCDDANSDSTGACSSTSSSSSGSSKERDWEGAGGGWADCNCQTSNGSSSNGHSANGHCEQQCEVSYLLFQLLYVHYD